MPGRRGKTKSARRHRNSFEFESEECGSECQTAITGVSVSEESKESISACVEDQRQEKKVDRLVPTVVVVDVEQDSNGIQNEKPLNEKIELIESSCGTNKNKTATQPQEIIKQSPRDGVKEACATLKANLKCIGKTHCEHQENAV